MPNKGSYFIWTSKGDGTILNPPPDPNPPRDSSSPTGFGPTVYPDPSDQKAMDIYFGIDSNGQQPPSKDQIDLYTQLTKVLSIVRRLYAQDETNPGPKFRRYYVRLFLLAQLGLEGATASPEVAKMGLDDLTQDLVDDEGGKVKNGHLQVLGWAAVRLSIPFLIIHVIFAHTSLPGVDAWLKAHMIDKILWANFMLLWLGCFIGVWLSYAIRTTVIALGDLTNTDSDRLRPTIRLLYAGVMTTVIGLLFHVGAISIKLGEVEITKVGTEWAFALLVGIFCGVSETTLPSVTLKRATDFVGQIK